MNICLLGPSGSGKTTQANLISNLLSLPIISSGDILRNIKDESVQLQVNSGKWVDSDFVFNLLIKQVNPRGQVFDGSPRTERELQMLHEYFISHNDKIDLLLCFELDHSSLYNRIKNRSDNRIDDTKQSIINQRLQNYYDNLQPIIQYCLKKQLNLHYIDAGLKTDDIHTFIKTLI